MFHIKSISQEVVQILAYRDKARIPQRLRYTYMLSAWKASLMDFRKLNFIVALFIRQRNCTSLLRNMSHGHSSIIRILPIISCITKCMHLNVEKPCKSVRTTISTKYLAE
uniref:Uncharacterized protein n=1 Tax=Glossina pallidipes TaxID=7398 RepID=A0A1A9ZN78_GLOPL